MGARPRRYASFFHVALSHAIGASAAFRPGIWGICFGFNINFFSIELLGFTEKNKKKSFYYCWRLLNYPCSSASECGWNFGFIQLLFIKSRHDEVLATIFKFFKGLDFFQVLVIDSIYSNNKKRFILTLLFWLSGGSELDSSSTDLFHSWELLLG